jgi:hypothetical protein
MNFNLFKVRNCAETEALMTSIERVLYTTINTPQEKAWFNPDIPKEVLLSSRPYVPSYYLSDATLLSDSSPSAAAASSKLLLSSFLQPPQDNLFEVNTRSNGTEKQILESPITFSG